MNVFEILIYSIATLALILAFLGVISYFTGQETSTKIIEKELQQAQAQQNLGKTMNLGQLSFEKNLTIEKVDLEKQTSIISFECLSPQNCCTRETDRDKNQNCDKAIKWDYGQVTFNENKKVQINLRCELVEKIRVCKVYFAGTPAQAKMKKIELLENNSGMGEIKVTVQNSGGQTLTFGKNTLILFKKDINRWQQTDYSQEAKEVETIFPGENYSFVWSINPKNSGTYRANFKFEAQNSGFDENSIEFEIDKTKTCQIDSRPNETTFDTTTGTYFENHYCTGCSYSFECKDAWTNNTPGTQFIPKTNEVTYCVKQEANESC